MPTNTIAYAEKYTSALDKALVQKPVTGFFADNALRAKFMGGKVVYIPDVDMQGLGNYNRTTGFVEGTVDVAFTPYQLSMERSRSFSIDSQDADESGVGNLAGEVLGEFMRTKVAPEMDAYVLSKLAGLAVNANQTITGAHATEALKMLQDGILKAQDAAGYGEELVAFVDSAVWAAICNTSELSKQLAVSNFKKGEIDTQVKSFNGVALIPVQSAVMKSAYVFNDGKTEGQEAGGFVPAGAAKNIGMLILPKRAVSLVKKVEKTRMYTPDQNQQADAWKIDVRLYYDCFVKKSMLKTLFAYTY